MQIKPLKSSSYPNGQRHCGPSFVYLHSCEQFEQFLVVLISSQIRLLSLSVNPIGHVQIKEPSIFSHEWEQIFSFKHSLMSLHDTPSS